MAAYAALVCLMRTIHLFRDRSRYAFPFHKNQIDSLSGKAQFLLEFVVSFNTSRERSEEVQSLLISIAATACFVENIIESHIVDQILLARSTPDHGEDQSQKSSSFLIKLQMKTKAMTGKVLKFNLDSEIYRMDSLVIIVMEVEKERKMKEQQPIYPMASASRLATTGMTSMVGFDRYMLQLMDLLTGQTSTRQIISVVGMGGIGKTTLTRNAYESSVILQHFDVRAWVTISQNCDIKQILSQLLGDNGESTKDTRDELGEKLHKKLFSRRYLIILDDMWSIDVWDSIRFFFPDNGNRSRIVITTRILNVSTCISSSSLVIGLLDMDESWKLFCTTVFGDEECPHDLVEIGKNIVGQCKGLPLSIVVIGGHLKKSLRIKEQWETVARNIMLFLDSGDDQCLSILSLSYTHLPACLKPCFLYMGVFPEDRVIHVPTLIRLWVAEGFLQPDDGRSFEEVGESYLKELVDRNLIFVQEQSYNEKILRCNVHDLLREVCLKVGETERFFCVVKNSECARRCEDDSKSCLVCDLGDHRFPKSRLLKIVPYVEGRIRPRYLEALFGQYFNLRYVFGYLLAKNRLPYAHIPSSISLCWNLQTLVIRGIRASIVAPSEIWEMTWLRHVDISDSLRLPDPPSKPFVMQSLQTLMKVENFVASEDVCRRIPNIIELQIYYNLEASSSLEFREHNLGRFSKLESLSLNFAQEKNWRVFARKLTYPSTLQELYLGGCGLHWEDLSTIGRLPHLEVFTVNSVQGKEWSPIEGEFLRLKSLTLHRCDDLIVWNAGSSHFPVLESLTLGNTNKLMEFPMEIGEIPTLQRVVLYRCSVSAAISAARALVEQEQLGNEDLRVEVEFGEQDDLERVKEMVQEEGLESNNFFLSFTLNEMMPAGIW